METNDGPSSAAIFKAKHYSPFAITGKFDFLFMNKSYLNRKLPLSKPIKSIPSIQFVFKLPLIYNFFVIVEEPLRLVAGW